MKKPTQDKTQAGHSPLLISSVHSQQLSESYPDLNELGGSTKAGIRMYSQLVVRLSVSSLRSGEFKTGAKNYIQLDDENQGRFEL